MKDQQTGSGGGKGAASPYEQTQETLNDIIKQIRGLEWSELLAKEDKRFKDAEVKIIGNNIKTEHAEEGEAADREQIEAIEDVKAAERLQLNCEYVRGLCKLTIKYKRDDREAIEGAKKVLELLPKIERGDYSLWRELEDTLFILMEALRTDNEEAKEKKEKTDTKTKRNRPTKAEMGNRNMAVAMAAANFKAKHDRLPTVDEIVAVTKFTRNQIYATDVYKEGRKIAKSSARVATEMTGGSVHESQQFSETSELHSRADKRSKADQAMLDVLIDVQEKDDKSNYVL